MTTLQLTQGAYDSLQLLSSVIQVHKQLDHLFSSVGKNRTTVHLHSEDQLVSLKGKKPNVHLYMTVKNQTKQKNSQTV